MIDGPENLPARAALYCGDCLAILPKIASGSVDAILTDPPYGLEFMGKEWDGADGFRRSLNEADAGRSNTFGRMSKRAPEYRAGHLFQAWCEAWARECLRVLKPGGHLMAFGGSRTYHRLACGIEDAGFEIRDQVQWLYGSGFPKSMDVAWAIASRAALRFEPREDQDGNPIWCEQCGERAATFNTEGEALFCDECHTTHVAGEFMGVGTALKPAQEPIVVARKPLIGTVAENVLVHGTGGININACRVPATEAATERESEPSAERRYDNEGATNFAAKPGKRRGRPLRTIDPKETDSNVYAGRVNGGEGFKGGSKAAGTTDLGRWPANVIHDGSDEVLAAFPDAPGQQRSVGPEHGAKPSINVFGDYGPRDPFAPRGDDGSAARFFYTAKADANDRVGSKHPTVKPLDLMQYLVRLIVPKGGLVLDPFAGTGTMGEAAFREGMQSVLIERDPTYQDDIRRRMALALAGPEERAREIAKARGKVTSDLGPLFAGATHAE